MTCRCRPGGARPPIMPADQDDGRREQAPHGRGGKGPGNQRDARRRAGDEPVHKAAFDITGQRHARIDAGESGAHHRGEREGERQVAVGADRQCTDPVKRPGRRHEDEQRHDQARDEDGRHAPDQDQRPPREHARHRRGALQRRRAHASPPRRRRRLSTHPPTVRTASHGDDRQRVAAGCQSTPTMTCARIPSTRRERSIPAATCRTTRSSSGAERRSTRRTSGQKTAGTCPGRPPPNRCAAPAGCRVRHGIPSRPASAITISAPSTPPLMVAPKMTASIRKKVAWPTASTMLANSRLIRIADRAVGDETRRSKKPPSMSPAKNAPAPTDEIRTPCTIAPVPRS